MRTTIREQSRFLSKSRVAEQYDVTLCHERVAIDLQSLGIRSRIMLHIKNGDLVSKRVLVFSGDASSTHCGERGGRDESGVNSWFVEMGSIKR